MQALNQLTVYVYEDLDGDGVYDPGEPDINGSDIHLDDVDTGADISSNGSLQVPLYVSGVHVVKHNTWIANYVASSAVEVSINHLPGSNHSVRFGLVREAEISGIVFEDKDGDNQKDSNESPLAGATIIIKDANNLQVGTSIVTTADGRYRFTAGSHGISSGTKYYVQETNPNGYASTSLDEVAVSLSAGSAAIVNFGDVLSGTISGYVYNDANGNKNKESGEQGLAQVTITILSNQSGDLMVDGQTYASGDIIMAIQTDSNGHYSVALPPGRYRVVETDPQGYVSTSSNDATITLPSSQTVTNFADMIQGVLTGMVYNDLNANGQLDAGEPGVSNITLNIDGSTPTTTTTNDGNFYLSGLDAGSYMMNAVVPTGFVATTSANQSVVVSSTSSNPGLLFGIKVSGTIDGEVFHDYNANGVRDSGEPGIGGVTLTLGGSGSGTTKTLTNGNFTFSGLTIDRTYTVTETDPTNYISVNSNNVTITLDNDGAANNTASFADLFEGTVSGIVFDDLDGNGLQENDERGMASVTVTLDAANTTTNNDGAYQFLRISGDGHSLSVTVPSAYFLTTNNNPTTIDMSSYSGSLDFGLQPSATIEAMVYSDANSNGTWDSGEVALESVGVSLGSGTSATTNANGLANFYNVQPGSDSVLVGALSGYTDTTSSNVPVITEAGGRKRVYFGKYINVAPWVDDDTVTIAESYSVNTIITDSLFAYVVSGDNNGDALSLSIIGGNTQGHFSLDSNSGELTLLSTLDYETTNSYSLTVQAQDGGGLADTAVITINVTDVNEAPVAQNQTASTPEDVVKSITLTGSDVDDTNLTYSVETQPSNGTLSGSAPNLTYTPNNNFFGSDSFTFKVNDGALDSTATTVTINVVAVNDAPVAGDDSASLNEDASIIIDVLANDSDVDSTLNKASVDITAQPSSGSVAINTTTGAVTYTPAAGYHGSDNFQYRVRDAQGVISNAANVAITVNSVNDLPVAANDTVHTNEDSAITPLDLLANDSDSDGTLDTASVVVVQAPSHAASYNITNGVLSYTPATNYAGPDQLTYTVDDNEGGTSNVVTVYITVQGVNDVPVANNDSGTTDEDNAVDINVIANDTDTEDGSVDATTVEIVSQPSNGALSVNGTTGVVTYTPDADFHGNDSFTYMVKDTGNSSPVEPAVFSNVATVSITVNYINDAPVANDDTVSVEEDSTAVAINVLGNDTDIDGSFDLSSITVVGDPSQGSVSVDTSMGKILYTPNADYNGADSFTYRISDDDGQQSNVATVSVTVTAVNDAPVANTQSVSTAEDTAKAITLGGSDTEGSGLSYNVVASPSHGVLSGTAPNLTYTPTTNYAGSDSFTFKINDGELDSAIATVNITITPVNDAPSAVNDNVTVNEDASVSIDILDNDNDPEGKLNRAAVNITALPTNGTISVSSSTGAVFYIPNADYAGTDSFQYQVSDTSGSASNSAEVTITVTEVNDKPQAVSDVITTDEDIAITPYDLLTNDVDIDDSLNAASAIIVIPPSNASSYSLVNGVLSYTPALNYVGNDQLTYIVEDASGALSNQTTVYITMIGVNDPPVANNDSATLDEDATVNIGVLSNDSDPEDTTPDATTVLIVSPPSNGSVSVNSSTGTVTYTPNQHYNGADSFTYMVKDTGNGSPVEPPLYSNQASVNLTINPINDTPNAVDDNIIMIEDDEPLLISALGNDSDVDGTLDVTTVTITSQPSNGSVSVNGTTGWMTYTPSVNYFGADSFTYTVEDNLGLASNTATVNIGITAFNDAPIANDQSVNTAEETALSITLTATDVDSTTLNYQVMDYPAYGNLSGSGANLLYTPFDDFDGNDSFTFFANDGELNSEPATVNITVTPVNDVPVVEDQSHTVVEDTILNMVLTANDADGDNLTFTVLTQPAQGTLTGSAPHLAYTPNADYFGNDSFTFRVNDGVADSAIATVSITVSPVDNDAPQADAQSLSTAEETPLVITLSGSDVDNQTLSFAVVTQPTNGTLSATAPNLTYTPTTNFVGTDNFTFTANDGDNDSTPATITISVTPINDVPVADEQAVSTTQDTPIAITLTGSDVESSTLTYIVGSNPSNGTLSGNGATRSYTPNSGYFGSDSFTFLVNDGVANSILATVSITVTEDTSSGNAPPTAANDELYVAIDTPRTLNVLANDSDPEGSALTLASVTSPVNGTLVINDDNTVTYTPSTGYEGTDSFTYTIVDIGNKSASATVSVNVVEPPNITPPDDVFVDATALFTKVDLGTATALDFQGKPLPTSVVDGITFFWPGNNTAVWQATDENGLIGYAEQSVKVRPLVSFSKDQSVAEGSNVGVKIVLNGPSPVYPVNVSYVVSGTASNPDDHDLISGTAVIASGTETSIVIQTVDDALAEGDETIVLTMSDENLNQGVHSSHTITISEVNIPPSVRLDVEQATYDRLTVEQSSGDVIVYATVTDPNVADTHTYDWSLSNNVLVDTDSDDTTFTFDPSTLEEGVYEVWLEVTDSGTPQESNIARVFIKVMASLPTLDTQDSDNDGISDADEGFADNDRDGIPDYLDSVPECNVLPEQGQKFDAYLIEGDPGVCTRLGNYALLGATGGTQITDADIHADETDLLGPDPEISNVGGIFDFIITEVPDNNQSVNIVIPQRQAIPRKAIYRKMNDGTWYTFVENNKNQLWSAAGEQGYCPPPGSDEFTPGLTEGHWCVQLTIEDGGPNDADGISNRMIVDPGGVGVPNTTTLTTKGGGSIDLLEALALLFFAIIALRINVTRIYATLILIMMWNTLQASENLNEFINTANIPPVAKDDTVNIKENTETKIPVLGNDYDEDNGKLIIIKAHAEKGHVVIEDNSILHYSPPDNYYGQDSIHYVIYDGQGVIPDELLDSVELDDSLLCIASASCVVNGTKPIVLRLKVNFENDSSNIPDEYLAEIEALADLLNQAPNERVIIEGHTSSVGRASYNRKLSEKRASAVANVLIEHLGIAKERVVSIGHGENKLLNLADTELAHTENRRIEAVFSGSLKKSVNKTSGIARARVNIEVEFVNSPPIANSESANLEQGQAIDINVLANDFDEESEMLKIRSASAQHGKTTVLQNGTLRYTPNKEFYGNESIRYEIEDEHGGIAGSDVTIKVNYVHKPWYLWVDTGLTKGSSSKSDLDKDFQSSGLNATTSSLDVTRMAGQFGLGYRFHSPWALEFGYVDLGEVSMSVTANSTDINQLYSGASKIHPLSGKGYLLAGQYHYAINENTDIFARLGTWRWKSKYTTLDGSKVGADSDRGHDLLFGFGGSMLLGDHISARLLIQRYTLDAEKIDFISLGITYRDFL